MALIDAHVHVATVDVARFPLRPGAGDGWFRELGHDAAALLANMDVAAVDGALIVQAVAAYGYDNSYAIAAAAALGRRAALVPAVWVGPAAEEVGSERPAGVQVLGIRVVASESQQLTSHGDSWTRLWERLDEQRLPLFATVWGRHLADLAKLALRYPDVPLVLDHAAFLAPSVLGQGARRELGSLLEHPNLFVKVTNANLIAAQRAGVDPFESVQGMTESVGPDRVMWGSDWPNSRVGDTYRASVVLAHRASARLAEVVRQAFLGGTIMRIARSGGWELATSWDRRQP